MGADVVSIAIDPERRLRHVPGGTSGTGRPPLLSGKLSNQHEKQNQSTAHLTIVDDVGRGTARVASRSGISIEPTINREVTTYGQA